MAYRITRRSFAAGVGTAALAGFGLRNRAHAADTKTLRFIAQSDLRVLDPIWTTAYITRNHGYMVFDTLFALDDKFQPHPQMVDDYHVSDDKLVYSFKLRDGLKFHDGQPVRGIDCTASLQRWMARDAFGQTLATAIAELKGGDDKTFSIRLKEPFPLLISAIAKVSSLVPFVMPERLAKTDPFKQITEMVGSGPFKFVASEFQPGNKVVYVKNTDYVPRSEPPNWASGGKIVKVDRVEWLVVPDHATAAAALSNGEVDWWENPPLDLVPTFAGQDVVVADADPLGSPQTLRFNHLWPPFDNVKMRQAVLAVANQADFMTTIAGDPKNWRLAPTFFTAGTPMASNAGSEALTGKRDFDKAKKLIAEAGYKGDKIVVLDATDQVGPHSQALVAADLMKKLELNVEIAAMDWGQLVTRRASTKPIAGRRMECLWHRLDRRRYARPDPEPAAAQQRQERLVRLADRRQDRGIARRMGQGERSRRPPRYRCTDPTTRLRNRALYSDRSVHAKDRLSQQHQRAHHRARDRDVERREDLTQAADRRSTRYGCGQGIRRAARKADPQGWSGTSGGAPSTSSQILI